MREQQVVQVFGMRCLSGFVRQKKQLVSNFGKNNKLYFTEASNPRRNSPKPVNDLQPKNITAKY